MTDSIPTAQGLADFAKEWLHKPNIYVWGGIGEYLTDEVLDEKVANEPEWHIEERIYFRRLLCNRGIRGFDCIGMINCYAWHDYHQGNKGFFKPEEYWTTTELIGMDLVKGDIADLPERPGLVLWRPGHVGVYIGNGEVIECTCRIPGKNEYDKRIGGIIKTTIAEVADDPELRWHTWLEYPTIQY